MMARFSRPTKKFFRILFALSLVAGMAGAFAQERGVASSDIDTAQIDETLSVLEDPQARERLVAQLKVMRAALEETQAPPSVAENAAGALFGDLSRQLQGLNRTAMQAASTIRQLPDAASWLQRQWRDDASRGLWGARLMQLLLSLGAAYLAYYVVARILRISERRMTGRLPSGVGTRLITLFVLALLRLLPVALFAAVAYLVSALTEPGREMRLVVVAWVAAFVIVGAVGVVGRAIFAAQEGNLRLLKLDDTSAAYGEIWLLRFARIGAYGYFGIQALHLMGLEQAPYAVLMNLLGVIFTGLLVTLILQNRMPVAALIRCGEESRGSPSGCIMRKRLATIWHLLAIFYVIFLFGAWILRTPDGFAFISRATLLTLAALAIAHALLHLLNTLFEHTLSAGRQLEERFPGIQQRADQYLPFLQGALRWVIYWLAALAVLQAWGLETLAWLASDGGQAFALMLARVLVIAIAAIAVWSFASSWMEGYAAKLDDTAGARSARTKTLVQVSSNALMIVVAVLATLLILSEIGIDIAPLLAGAGVVGLAIGFGAQTLVKDVITGTFILLQNHMTVGEVVKVGDTAGLVEALSIRHVRLRDLSGTVHTIPFSSITTISNLTKEYSYHVFDVGVAYRENADQVMELLAEIGEEMRQDEEYGPLILEPLEVFGLDRFADSAIIIKGRIKTPPIKQWMVGREFNRRVKRRFDELGIEIPFPHRTLYFGIDKEGKAPPLSLRTEHDDTEELVNLASGRDATQGRER